MRHSQRLADQAWQHQALKCFSPRKTGRNSEIPGGCHWRLANLQVLRKIIQIWARMCKRTEKLTTPWKVAYLLPTVCSYETNDLQANWALNESSTQCHYPRQPDQDCCQSQMCYKKVLMLLMQIRQSKMSHTHTTHKMITEYCWMFSEVLWVERIPWTRLRSVMTRKLQVRNLLPWRKTVKVATKVPNVS